MDMYQKREMRKNKNMNENKTNINWYKPNYGKLPMKSYK
mgnify:CR=1 FL=1